MTLLEPGSVLIEISATSPQVGEPMRFSFAYGWPAGHEAVDVHRLAIIHYGRMLNRVAEALFHRADLLREFGGDDGAA